MASAPSPQPSVREVVDRAAAELSPVVAEIAASDRFLEAAEVGAAIRKLVAAEVEKRSRRLLHFWNLPAGSDIAALRREIGELDRQVRDLTRRLEALGEDPS